VVRIRGIDDFRVAKSGNAVPTVVLAEMNLGASPR